MKIRANLGESEQSCNKDKLMLKMQLLSDKDFSLNNKEFAINIGNYVAQLKVKAYKKNGQIIKLANTPVTKDDLTIKGKIKLDAEGIIHLIVDIRNANVSELLNIQNQNKKNS